MTPTPAPAPPRLRARTEPVADPGDLLDHLGAGGFAWLAGDAGFVTSGVAAVVTPAEATAVLRTVEHTADPGVPASAGPRAVGALGFADARTGRLTVPAVIVGRDPDGRAWRTTVAGAPAPLHAAPRPASRFTVRSLVDPGTWAGWVSDALAAIGRGPLEKVVLARAVRVEADVPFDVVSVLRVLRATQPGCTVYADGGFVGASPELLVRRQGADVVSRPMAGTGRDAARLRASEKDVREHRVVVDAVAGTLGDLCDEVRAGEPEPARFATIVHLATDVRARLGQTAVSALDLALALHPTPAVSGWPVAAALDAIARLEGRDRGRYAGPCGWVGADGDGEFVVALRGAQLDGDSAVLHAGAGIVAGSEPGAEWAETQAKLEPMLRALVRP
ncbi:MAG: isochorismate synthase [Acidimicrobiia bacterium]|nr:MAG: isochorismate synthase [Acidimicrobiia bacterium]